jgi:hypothetical protein
MKQLKAPKVLNLQTFKDIGQFLASFSTWRCFHIPASLVLCFMFRSDLKTVESTAPLWHQCIAMPALGMFCQHDGLTEY